uniref:Reverse transcriptase domain-containing protein n=1 Tax=Peronospora matthiolae TaxID=2874970 RepID=A0AAV1VI80_9STRA
MEIPGVWSRLLRVIFDKFDFVVVYLDDICVFSKSNADHIRHLREMFKVRRKEKLYAHRGKCSFGKDSVALFGHTMSKNGLSVDQRKTAAIEQMKAPSTRKDLMSFLGLSGHYRQFVCAFAQIALSNSEAR